MTLLPHFPILRGLGWSFHRKPAFDTNVSQRVSGRRVVAENRCYPLYDFELTYNYLRTDRPYSDLEQIEGLFLSSRGQSRPFLFSQNTVYEPNKNRLTGQLLGAGNAVRTSFTFIRSVGLYSEPVGQVEPNGLNVYVGGLLLPSTAYSVVMPNQLVLNTTPLVGQQVTADFNFYFVCAFLDDQHDYEEFMKDLWTLQSCKLRSVKP